MGLTDRVVSALGLRREVWPTLSWDQYAELLSFNGNAYLTGGLNQTIRGQAEDIDPSFGGLVQQAYRQNGVVFACMLARMQLFSQARFQYQQLAKGRPGVLFSNPSLDILEHPWPNGVTGDLLARAIQDVDLGGNFFATRRRWLRRLRPDWVTIVLGSPNDPEVEAGDIDAEVLGYIYHPGGRASGREPEGLLAEEVAHWAPIPDPLAAFRGMSWLTPIIREISADKAMTEHKNAYLVNGATPNLVVSLDKDLKAAENPAAFSAWIEAFQKANPNRSSWDKFRTMYLAGGTSVTVAGDGLAKIDFRAVQGAGEVRIAIASGAGAALVGLSEGLQGAALNDGNYKNAKRKFADFTIRWLWQTFAASMETIVPPPPGSRLWVDDRDIPALAEDQKDIAEVKFQNAQTMRQLLDGGFTAESVIAYVATGDQTQLVHTGLFSVQLQAPGSTKMPAGEVPGETPVGPGTKPEVLPAGDVSTKPLALGTGKPTTPTRELLAPFLERP